MKPLSDVLKRLFGISPETTPAVPSALRDAAAAEAATPPRYDYPLVPSLDDLSPDPNTSSKKNTVFFSRVSIDAQETEADSGDASVHEPPPAYGAGTSRPPSVNSPDVYHQASAHDDFLSDLNACDPRAFSKRLQQGVREVHGGNPVAFYNAAGISRSAYSRLISHPDRHPSKDTVLCMAAALHMALPDAEDFLRLAGYALSPHMPVDLIWRHCFQQGIHELPAIRSIIDRVLSPSH